MKPKLMLLAMFTAVVSFACVSNSRGVSVENMGPGAPGNPFRPITLQRTDLVAGGKCVARLTYDQKSGDPIKVETDPPCVTGQRPLRINDQELRDISGSITFGSGTSTCYPWGCVCTRLPCP